MHLLGSQALGGEGAGRREADAAAVEVRALLLADVGSPRGGADGLEALRALAARCCPKGVCAAGAEGLQGLGGETEGVAGCAGLMALGALSVSLPPADAGAPAPAPPPPAPPPSGGGAGGGPADVVGLPAWVPPTLGIGVAGLCLLCVGGLMVRSERDMARKLEEEEEEEGGGGGGGGRPQRGVRADGRAPGSQRRKRKRR